MLIIQYTNIPSCTLTFNIVHIFENIYKSLITEDILSSFKIAYYCLFVYDKKPMIFFSAFGKIDKVYFIT